MSKPYFSTDPYHLWYSCQFVTHCAINKKREIIAEIPLVGWVTSGARTHDIQNHNLTL